MLSALLMLRRVSKAFRYAVREDEFLNVFGAGVLLVVIGTVTYSLGAGWSRGLALLRGRDAHDDERLRS